MSFEEMAAKAILSISELSSRKGKETINNLKWEHESARTFLCLCMECTTLVVELAIFSDPNIFRRERT